MLHRLYAYVQESRIDISGSPQMPGSTGGLYIYTFMWRGYYILCIVNDYMLATATDLHSVWKNRFGVNILRMESYMFLDLEPGSSLGEEGAVHGGECTAGKAKISLFFIIGQWSVSKSFLYGLSGTVKPSVVTATVRESIRGHENLPSGSWETFILSVDHESWKTKCIFSVLASQIRMGESWWHHLYSAPDPASERMLWSLTRVFRPVIQQSVEVMRESVCFIVTVVSLCLSET